MTGLLVAIRPPTKEGRLYPRYDEETDLLVLESEVEREWPFGVDVDGRVVFDVDAHAVLANVDIHIGRRRWIADLEGAWPSPEAAGDLVFDRQTLMTKSFSLPLRIRCDSRREQMRMELGAEKPDRAVYLSDDCAALLSGRALVGLAVRRLVVRDRSG